MDTQINDHAPINVEMSITTGQAAPDFTLFDDSKSEFALSAAYASKAVVLLFFPGAFTSTCTTELNMVSNDLESYGEDSVVVGISTDSPFSLAEFRKVNGFRFQLLSDHDGKVSELYGAKYDGNFTHMNMDRISRRAAFVVDRSGTVRYAEVLENAGDIPDLDAVKSALAGIRG